MYGGETGGDLQSELGTRADKQQHTHAHTHTHTHAHNHRKSDAQALPETQAEYTDLMKSQSDNKTTRHLSAEQKRTETQHRPDHPLK